MLENVLFLLLSSLRTLYPGDNFYNSLKEQLEKIEERKKSQAPTKLEPVYLKQTP